VQVQLKNTPNGNSGMVHPLTGTQNTQESQGELVSPAIFAQSIQSNVRGSSLENVLSGGVGVKKGLTGQGRTA